MVKQQTLLEKAKNSNPRKSSEKDYSEEEIELVKAWIDGGITLAQLQRVKGFKYNNEAYAFVAFVCRSIFSERNGTRK